MNTLILANLALPSVFGHQFYMLIALSAVIGIESFVVSRVLKKSLTATFAPCAKANIISTLLGFPIGYLVSFVFFFLSIPAVSIVAGQDATLVNVLERLFGYSLFSGGTIWHERHLEILAAVFMLIPYYYASVFIENKCLQGNFPDIAAPKVRRAVIIMNKITYSILGLLILVFFFIENHQYNQLY